MSSPAWKLNSTPKTSARSTRKLTNSQIREILAARDEVLARPDGREPTLQAEEYLGFRYTQTEIAEIVWNRGRRFEATVTLIEAAIPRAIQWSKIEGAKAEARE